MTGKQLYESKERSCKWEELSANTRQMWIEVFPNDEILRISKSIAPDSDYSPKYLFADFMNRTEYVRHKDQIIIMDEIYELERKENECK